MTSTIVLFNYRALQLSCSSTIVRRSASHAVLDALRPVFSAGTVQSCKTTAASSSIASCRSA
ncbi:hypothetical protein PscP12857CL_26150 [Pseudomonas syringae]|nr:hypothetical protein [Pseudomonas syringae]